MKALILWLLNIIIALTLLGVGYLTCMVNGIPSDFSKILRGGSLLFFASTLTGSHFLRYYIESRDPKYLQFRSPTRAFPDIIPIIGLLLVWLYSASIYSNIVLGLLRESVDTVPSPLSLPSPPLQNIVMFSLVGATIAILYSLTITIMIERIKGNLRLGWQK